MSHACTATATHSAACKAAAPAAHGRSKRLLSQLNAKLATAAAVAFALLSRRRSCLGQKGCVFSREAIEAHIKQGPNRGHKHVLCPIQGCNKPIMGVKELQDDKAFERKVKAAKRKAERLAQSQAMDEEEGIEDLTQR